MRWWWLSRLHLNELYYWGKSLFPVTWGSFIIWLWSSPVADDEETMSEAAYPSRRSRLVQPARSSSSRAMMPLRRLDTLTEVHSVDVVDEKVGDRRRAARGTSRTNSSSSRDPRIPAPQRHHSSADNGRGSADNFRNGHREEEEEEPQPLSPAPSWAAEPREDAAQNPLLRRPQWKPKK